MLQHDQSDCGVACLLSLIRYYEGNHKLERLRELSGTSKQGTTLLGLYQAANKVGFKAEGNEADIKSLIDLNQPAILHLVIDNNQHHYVICYGYFNGIFLIGDPVTGIIEFSEEELKEKWQSKACLTLTPNQSFLKTRTEQLLQRKWFYTLLEQDRKILLFSILLGFGIAFLGMTMAIFSQKLIDDILPSKELNKLITGLVLLAFLLLIRTFLEALREFFLVKQTKDFNIRIIDRFYNTLLYLSKPFFDTRRIGELVARLNDTERVQEVIRIIIGTTVINALVTLVSLGYLFYFSWQTGLIALLTLPIYFLLIYGFNNKIIAVQREVMQGYANSESNYISSMLGIESIKNNNRQPTFRRINQLVYGSYQESFFQLGRIKVNLSLLSGLFSVLFMISILAFTSIKVHYGVLKLGELMAIMGISGTLLPSVAGLALITIPINEAKVAFIRMYEFASMEQEETGSQAIGKFKLLEVRNLGFRYPGRSQLLKDINITVRKHECVAIIGESGCGKSTFGQILQKFYPFENGTILVNSSYNLADLKTEEWRRLTGVISQEITIFDGSIVDNILIGLDDTPENIAKFIEEYGFQAFIDELPQGLATMLGDTGINLSGGQKQLIALMRVLYKRPELLILDEFTSAMDRNTEQFAIEMLNNLKSKMGILFISHRLHVLRSVADFIYVIQDGKTAVAGTHNQLLESKNFYSEYWAGIQIPDVAMASKNPSNSKRV